jgi:hypothetical protein
MPTSTAKETESFDSAHDVAEVDTDGASMTSSGSGSKKSGKEKFALLVRGATKVAEQGAGYVSGQKQMNWEKISRVCFFFLLLVFR